MRWLETHCFTASTNRERACKNDTHWPWHPWYRRCKNESTNQSHYSGTFYQVTGRMPCLPGKKTGLKSMKEMLTEMEKARHKHQQCHFYRTDPFKDDYG